MKKIVINACFGGFGLSHKAVMRYAEIKEFRLYPWFDYITRSVYKDRAVIGAPGLLYHYSKVPLEGLSIDKNGDPKVCGDEYFSDRDIPRDDPALIQVVEEMGKDASDKLAELKIVEIPDGIDWEIEEYDGREHIAEKHQTWS